jgi:hypothetical protein
LQVVNVFCRKHSLSVPIMTRDLPASAHRVIGTDTAKFRLGDRLAIRVPRRPSAVPLPSKELEWLRRVQDRLQEVPMPRFKGNAEHGLVFEFGAFDWIESHIASPDHVIDWQSAARSAHCR